MAKDKPFDCVEMKNTLQAKLKKELQGMTDEEARAYINNKLATSDHPAAKLWRELRRNKAASTKS